MASEVFVAGHDGWEPFGEGITRKILGYDEALMMVCVRFERGAVGAMHHHTHRQVTYVAEGAFETHVGDSTRVLHAGDSFFVPPNAPHGVTALEPGMLIDVFAPAREDFIK